MFRCSCLNLEARLSVVEKQLHARRKRLEDFRMRHADALLRPRTAVEIEFEAVARGKLHAAVCKGSKAELWALQIRKHTDRARHLFFDRANDVVALLVIFVRAMAEIEPEDIGVRTNCG